MRPGHQSSSVQDKLKQEQQAENQKLLANITVLHRENTELNLMFKNTYGISTDDAIEASAQDLREKNKVLKQETQAYSEQLHLINTAISNMKAKIEEKFKENEILSQKEKELEHSIARLDAEVQKIIKTPEIEELERNNSTLELEINALNTKLQQEAAEHQTFIASRPKLNASATENDDPSETINLKIERDKLLAEKAHHHKALNQVQSLVAADQLKQLTEEYLRHLASEVIKSLGPKKQKIKTMQATEIIHAINQHLEQSAPKSDLLLVNKFKILSELYEILNNEKEPTAKVADFYMLLKENNNEQQLIKHRRAEWQHYALKASVIAIIVLTGVFPGLVILGLQASKKTEPSSNKSSASFWNSHGKNYVNTVDSSDGSSAHRTKPNN